MNRIITAIIGIVAVIAITLSTILYFNQPRTAYVDIKKLYDSFELKKELEAKLTNVTTTRKNMLDSLELRLKMMAQSMGKNSKDKSAIENFQLRREEFLQRKQKFEQDNQQMTQQYNDQIVKQLDQYVKDYGKENHYTYVFGAEGSGSLMYADESKNITENVLHYLNEKYKGVSKVK